MLRVYKTRMLKNPSKLVFAHLAHFLQIPSVDLKKKYTFRQGLDILLEFMTVDRIMKDNNEVLLND